MTRHLSFGSARWQRAIAAGAFVALAATGCGDASEDASQNGEDQTPDSLEQTTGLGGLSGLFGGNTGGSTTIIPNAGHPSTSTSSGTSSVASASTSGSGGGSGSGSLYCNAQAVINKNCTACHDGQGTGGSPMGLTKYADFQANAPISSGKKVYQAVSSRVHDSARPMPPRGLLGSADLGAIDAWVNAGAPSGGDCGSSGGGGSAKPLEDWSKICDDVYELRSHGTTATSPYVVPANQEIHPQITINPPWGSTRVQAIGWRPISDNRKVLHHWILYQGSAFMVGWAPGDDDRPPYPSDVGMSLPNGNGSLRLDFHYFNTGNSQSEQDRSGVAVCTVKGGHLRKQDAAVTMSFTSFGPILAPANSKNYDSTGRCTVTALQPVHLMTAAPHAHKLAVHMKFSVRKVTGQTIVMHDEPFKFGEQGTYGLTPEVILSTGDQVTTTCTFTNPTNRSVTFGESTTNEMCFNFAAYYPKGSLPCL